jgi:hypothetical protein
MLRLTGGLADGLFVSYNYVPPNQLAGINRLVDDGAREAGREPGAVRRGYNLMGVLDTGSGESRVPGSGL